MAGLEGLSYNHHGTVVMQAAGTLCTAIASEPHGMCMCIHAVVFVQPNAGRVEICAKALCLILIYIRPHPSGCRMSGPNLM